MKLNLHQLETLLTQFRVEVAGIHPDRARDIEVDVELHQEDPGVGTFFEHLSVSCSDIERKSNKGTFVTAKLEVFPQDGKERRPGLISKTDKKAIL